MIEIPAKIGQKVLNTQEAARVLRISKRTLEDWRSNRMGPVYLKRKGGRHKTKEVFYHPKDLEFFARNNKIVTRKRRS